MSLFDNIEDPAPPTPDTVPGICQECRNVVQVPDTGDQFACTLGHEAPAPVWTIKLLFRTLADIEKAIKIHGPEPGVLKHKETFLGLMRELQAAVLAESEEEPAPSS
jgi:hypothetical protein